MLLVNTTKRIHSIATRNYEERELVAKGRGNGMPDGMVKLIPSMNEISVDDFISIYAHPDFEKSFSKGQYFLIGKDAIIDKVATAKASVKVKQLKEVKGVGNIKGVSYEAAPDKLVNVKQITAVFAKALATFPKNLKEIKDLLGYSEKDAMKIAEFTMDVNVLKRWLKVEDKYNQDNENGENDSRDGVT